MRPAGEDEEGVEEDDLTAEPAELPGDRGDGADVDAALPPQPKADPISEMVLYALDAVW